MDALLAGGYIHLVCNEDCVIMKRVQWFHGLGLSESEIAERLKHCRHKAQFEPASTPGHFWSISFPTTQQYKEQGM